MSEISIIRIPCRKNGRQSSEANEQYQRELREFAETLIQLDSGVEFKVSARGWCYTLEAEAGLSKGDFDRAESVINECRKEGRLPIDFTAADSSRTFDCVQYVGDEPEDEAIDEVERLKAQI